MIGFGVSPQSLWPLEAVCLLDGIDSTSSKNPTKVRTKLS